MSQSVQQVMLLFMKEKEQLEIRIKFTVAGREHLFYPGDHARVLSFDHGEEFKIVLEPVGGVVCHRTAKWVSPTSPWTMGNLWNHGDIGCKNWRDEVNRLVIKEDISLSFDMLESLSTGKKTEYEWTRGSFIRVEGVWGLADDDTGCLTNGY